MASMKKIRGLLVEIGGDTSKLESALKNVDKTTSSLSKELKGVNTLLKFDPSDITLLNQKSKLLSDSISETSKKVEALKQAQQQLDSSSVDKNTEEYRYLQREIINTTNKLSDLINESSKLTKIGDTLDSVGNKFQKVGSKIDSLGNKLTIGVSAPIVSFGIYAGKAASDFETAFTGVIKTVNGTEEQLAELKQGIIDLSEEIPASTTEIAAVAEAAGQLGIETDNVLGFTKAMIDLGNSTNLASEEAASQLARFANIMGMSQKDFDKLGSAIVDLGNNYATTESDIVNMAMRLAGAGKQVNLSEGEVLGLATALSSVGIEAEMGGSAISKAIVKMQVAVENGGSKLNAVLKKTGLSLRELELLSANDSSGFKGLAQDIGMTSTELKNLITAGTNLQDFAAISGKSAEEFQKAWKEDAAGAIIAFIQGLGNAEEKGESAISMLTEMGLTETRLRDSLLRAANAGNLFNKAIENGNSAWKENTALTNEANKRYETTESQMTIAKNKLNNIAITLGNSLLPHVNEFLGKLDNLTKKFSSLSKEEQKNVLKTMAVIATIGPGIKIIGKFNTAVGTTVKGIGTFTKACSLMKNGVGTATGSAATLARTMQALSSPVGIATTAIGLFTAAVVVSYEKQKKEIEAYQKKIDKLKETSDAYNEVAEASKKQAEEDLTTISNSQRLYDELVKIVDADGKVKDGYEERAKFITGELSKALGLEIDLTDGVIQKYKDVQKEIKNTILTKKANIIFESMGEQYKEAYSNNSTLYRDRESADKEVKALERELSQKKSELHEKQMSDLKNGIQRGYSSEQSEINKIQKKLDIAKQGYDEINKTYEQQLDILREYESASAIIYSNDADAIQKWVSEQELSYKTAEGNRKSDLSNSITYLNNKMNYYRKHYEEALKNQDETSAKRNKAQLDSNQKQLDTVVEGLIGQTSTINENSPQVIEAWEQLANTSHEKYNETLLKLPEDLRKTIQEMTGVPFDMAEGLAYSLGNLALTSKEEFEKKISDLPPEMQETVRKIAQSVQENSGTVTEETSKMMTDVLDELDKQDDAKIAGINLLKGLKVGLKDKDAVADVDLAVSTFATNMLSRMKRILGINSPSKKTEEFSQNLLRGFIVGVDDLESDVLSRTSKFSKKVLDSMNLEKDLSIFDDIQPEFHNRITDATKMIFTTPHIQFYVQQMNKENLDAAFKYINDKFGSEY